MNTFEQMIERGHERICFHHDESTGLRAIIAVHSTVLGNADIQATTACILDESTSAASTHAAAVQIARRRIAEGLNQSEQVYAG